VVGGVLVSVAVFKALGGTDGSGGRTRLWCKSSSQEAGYLGS
jgi:hypothetical protein